MNTDDKLEWNISHGTTAFLKLLQKCHTDFHFFFMIDGIDEVEGEPMSLVELLKSLSTIPHVQICVSSRWTVHLNQTLLPSSKLVLHDVNGPDIDLYVKHQLSESRKGGRQPSIASGAVQKMPATIVLKAEGVFLWARLAVDSVLKGLANNDEWAELNSRIDLVPTRLETLYSGIAKSIEPQYLLTAARLFTVMMATEKPLTLLTASFLLSQTSLRTSNESRPPKELLTQQCENTRTRLKTICGGLIHLRKFQNAI